MHKHEEKTCPRCNGTFECKVGDIAHCQCSEQSFTLEEKAFIEDRYNDCLCADCLKDLKNKYVLFREKFLFNGR